MPSLGTPFCRCIWLAEGTWYGPSVRIIVGTDSSWVVSVGTGLAGIEMRKGRYGVRIVSEIGCRVIGMGGG